MGWIKDIFSSSVGAVVDSIGEAIDKNVTNDEERLVLRNELVRLEGEAKRHADNIDVQVEQEVTKRHQADMNSDNKLSKNIRPGALVFLTVAVVLMSVTDGNLGEFTVGKDYIELFKALLLVVYGFYFSSRGVEKAVKTWKGQ